MSTNLKPKTRFLSNILTVFYTNNQTNSITGFHWQYISLFVMQIGVMIAEFGQIFSVGLVLEGLSKLNSGYNYQEFIKIALIGISLGIIQALLTTLLSYREEMLIEHTYQKLYKSGINKVISYNLQWQETMNAGNKATIIKEGSVSLARLLGMIPQIFILSISVIITIVYLSLVNIWLLPLGSAAIGICLIVTFFTQPIVRSSRKQATKIYENYNGKIYEALNNIYILKSSGGAPNILTPIYQLFAQVLSLEKKIIGILSLRNMGLNIIILIIGGIYILYGGYLILIGAISFGVMYAGYRYLMRLSQEVNRFTRLTIELGLMEVKAGRFYDIYNLELNDNFSGITNTNNQSHYNPFRGIEVIFRVKNGEIKKGQKIGFVGTTGSGKSTFVKLLSGLYPINSGSIEITTNKQKINFYDQSLDSWHSNQFLVAQDPELFNATILENITLFDSVLNQDLLDKSILISQLTSVIAELPKGLETLIGEKGYKLSGGQRQRIGIARAMYRNADIICFDESTSALDSKTEQDFQTALEQTWETKTLIFIAHRLSTLKNVDIIYVFENGHIIEQGSFEALVKLDGKFNELWQLQQKEVE